MVFLTKARVGDRHSRGVRKSIAGKSQVRKFIVRNPCVTAKQWDGQSKSFEHLSENFRDLISLTEGSYVVVTTPDGQVMAKIGDWIVQDASGAVFVMNGDIFNLKYKQLG